MTPQAGQSPKGSAREIAHRLILLAEHIGERSDLIDYYDSRQRQREDAAEIDALADAVLAVLTPQPEPITDDEAADALAIAAGRDLPHKVQDRWLADGIREQGIRLVRIPQDQTDA